MAILHLLKGFPKTQFIRLKLDTSGSAVTIGRRGDIQFPDVRLSRCHARLMREGNEYYIEDRQSRHGTFINGYRIRHDDLILLQNNDQIRILDFLMRFEIEDDYSYCDKPIIVEVNEHKEIVSTNLREFL